MLEQLESDFFQIIVNARKAQYDIKIDIRAEINRIYREILNEKTKLTKLEDLSKIEVSD